MEKDILTSDVYEIQLVVFKLAKEFYGIDISSVQEIIKIQDITRVPKAPGFVEGVINLRGKIVPIVDLRRRFELGQTERTKDTRVIVVETSGNIVGFIVDLVTEILRFSSDSLEPPPPIFSGIDAEYIKGVAKVDERLIVLLDINLMFKGEEEEGLKMLEAGK